MKKLSALLLLLSLLFYGCKDNDSHVETWTVASEKGVAGIALGFGYTPAYIVKRSPNTEWEIFSGNIQGFTFEKGFESTLRVRIDKISNPPADGSSHSYTMEQLISRTPTQQDIDPKQFCPEFEIVIASERADKYIAAYWFKDIRYTEPRWQAFPWEIEGFDFKPGYESHVRIQPVAEYDDAQNQLIDSDSWTVKYYLKELISSEEKASEGLPIH